MAHDLPQGIKEHFKSKHLDLLDIFEVNNSVQRSDEEAKEWAVSADADFQKQPLSE